MKRFFKYTVLLFPIVFFWAGSNMHKAKYANDPEYIYLVNAVAICDGKFVGHIDNPGTTVMQLGAATIAAKHWFSNPDEESLVKHVFNEPDQFVSAIRFLFLILNSLVLLLIGWFAIKKTGSVWAGLFLQLTTFITANTLDHVWTKMSPEPVLFFVTGLYVIAILFYFAEKEKKSWKYVFIFALLSGAGLGTKATFLPLVISPFVVIPTIKKIILYVLSIVPSFVLFTIPAFPEYENMYFWFRGLLSHSGKYGHGEKGLIDVETYFPNMLKIIENNPVFATAFFAGFVVVLFKVLSSVRKKEKLNQNIRFLAGLTATTGFGILLVAKHYHFNHYLIPVLLLTGISIVFVLNSLSSEKIRKITFPVLVIGLTAFLAWRQPAKMKYASDGYKLTNSEMQTTNLDLEKNYSEYTRIYFYPFSFYPESALNFGDVYCKRQMLPYLKKLYPNTYFYDFYWKSLKYWNADVSLEEVIEFNGNKVLMLGNHQGKDVITELEANGIPLKEIYKGRIQSFFEIDTVKYKRILQPKQIIEQVVFDAEILSSDNQNFTDSIGNNFGPAFTRTSEQARSGSFSIKMDEKTEFALDYKTESLKPGDEYEIDVWRKADNYSGRLVVAGSNNTFYAAQNDFVTSDKNGWDLIRIRFTVSTEMEGETVKVYLWNPKKKLAYFDDLTIKKIR